MEILCDVSHDGSFIWSHVTDIFNIKEGLDVSSVLFLVRIRESQFFLLQRMQVRNSDGDCVVVKCCIAINLDGIDQSMRN